MIWFFEVKRISGRKWEEIQIYISSSEMIDDNIRMADFYVAFYFTSALMHIVTLSLWVSECEEKWSKSFTSLFSRLWAISSHFTCIKSRWSKSIYFASYPICIW